MADISQLSNDELLSLRAQGSGQEAVAQPSQAPTSLKDLSDDDLLALRDTPQPESPSDGEFSEGLRGTLERATIIPSREQLATGAENFKAIGLGILEGALNIDLFLRDVVTDKLGITSKETTEEIREFKEEKSAEFKRTAPGLAARGLRAASRLGLELVGPAKVASGLGLAARGASAGAGLLSRLGAAAPGVAGDVLVGGTVSALEKSDEEGGAGRGRAALTGGLLAGGIGTAARGLSALRPVRSASKEAAFAREGIRPSVGTVTDSKVAQTAERGMSHIPFVGTKGAAKARLKGLQQAGQRFVDKLKKTAPSIDDPVKTIGDDLAASRTRWAAKVSNKEKRLYENVFEGTDDIGKFGIPATKAKIAELLKTTDSKLLNPNVSRESAEILRTLQEYPRATLREIHSARQILDDVYSKVVKQSNLGNAGKQEVRALAQIRTSLENELGEAATMAGKGQAYTRAKEFYQNMVIPLKAPKVERLFGTKGDVDRVIDTFIKSDSPKLAKSLLRSLDSKGRRALEAGIINKAYQKSLDKASQLDPTKFINNIKKLRKTLNVTLSKENKQAVDGLIKINNAIQEVGAKTGSSPITAAQAIGGGGGTAGVVAATGSGLPTALASIAATTGVLSQLMTRKAGIALLTRAGKLSPKSAAFGRIMQELNRLVSGFLAGKAQTEE